MAINTRACEIPVGFFESIPLRDKGRFYKHVNILTEKQRGFVSLLNEWFRSPSNDIIVVSGNPGTGKTFTVINTLFYVDVDIIKMAYTGKIACNIGGSTIHSTLNIDWQEGSTLHKIVKEIEKLDDEDPEYIKKCLKICEDFHKEISCSKSSNIILIDEVSLIPVYLTLEIINHFKWITEKPKLFIFMGDKYQLKPVKCKYNIFDISTLNYKLIELDDNKRFTPDYNIIIKTLKDIMKENDIDKFFNYINTVYPILEEVYDFTLKDCNRVLVYKNQSAEKYNTFYINNLPGPKIIFPKINGNTIIHKDPLILKKNCDIVINRNCEVPNGTFLQFITYDDKNDLIVCKYPNLNTFVKILRVCGQFPVTVGFASTIHKFQGETINDPKVLIQFDESNDMHLIYTALSRVRSMHQILGIILQ